MSYSHDLHLYPNFDSRAFAMAVEDIGTLVARTEIPIVGPEARPHSFPILDSDPIAFIGLNRNCVCHPGMPEDRFCPPECQVNYPNRNDSYQAFSVDVRPHMVVPTSFHLRGPEVYWFDCKTRRRPYDLLVMTAMIALKHHLGDSMIAESSGRWEYEWNYRRGFPEGARGVYEHVFPDLPQCKTSWTSSSIRGRKTPAAWLYPLPVEDIAKGRLSPGYEKLIDNWSSNRLTEPAYSTVGFIWPSVTSVRRILLSLASLSLSHV